LLLRKRISNRRLWSTKEGVGETSGQTAGPVFSIELALAKTGSAEERSFLHRCGSKAPQFHRRLAGWDLVLTCSPTPSFPARALPPGAFPKILKHPFRLPHGFMPAYVAPMVIALPNGTVNRIRESHGNPANKRFCDFATGGAPNPFRFDSSQSLNCSSNLIGHDHPNKPANGGGE
jgi:hypothetical protein